MLFTPFRQGLSRQLYGPLSTRRVAPVCHWHVCIEYPVHFLLPEETALGGRALAVPVEDVANIVVDRTVRAFSCFYAFLNIKIVPGPLVQAL